MRYVRNDSINPYFNIAFEEYCFENIAKDEDYFFIWQNGPSIIVGSHQNVLQEINPHVVYQNNLPVVRRISGGGTVYHDLGNINFTFVFTGVEGKMIDYRTQNFKIMEALRTLGLETTMSDRHDILFNGKKISGNAQRVHKDRVLHHGTILFDTNLSNLQKSLHFKKKSIQSKAIPSVRSEVVNIKKYLNRPIEVDEFREFLIKQLSQRYHDQEIKLEEDDYRQIRELVCDKFLTWEWNFGESPKFSYQNLITIGEDLWYVDLKVKDGMINQCEVMKNNKKIEDDLIGVRYDINYLIENVNYLDKKYAMRLFFGDNH
jgi:lipoate-protein ligase A